MFDPDYPLDGLRPADYNPRHITHETLASLQDSLRTLGMVKPVIVTQAGLLIAGHQRTKAAKALGWSHVPAFVLPEVNATDEIRFNQLHNAADLERGGEQVCIPRQEKTGFVLIRPEAFRADTLRVSHAMKRSEMLRLMAKYGDWGACVALQSGEVVVSGLYALCAVILKRPCLCYVLPDSERENVARFFGRTYGVFSYAHLPKTTWVQSLAQMMRLRETETGEKAKDGSAKGKSRTYENLVLPRLEPGMRVLDFGAGQMDYVKRLQKVGVDILGIEFYLRKGRHLDTQGMQRDVDRLLRSLERGGRFDMVICDSVLNSVDSMEAERDVLTCLGALCREGGTVIFSGRSRDQIERKATNNTTNTDPDTRYLHFLDEHGFSAMFANGVWKYQKFHTYPEVAELAREFFGSEFTVYLDGGTPARGRIPSSGWGCVAVNRSSVSASEQRAALGREFDLPLPGGKSIGRAEDIVRAWDAARNRLQKGNESDEDSSAGEARTVSVSVAEVCQGV